MADLTITVNSIQQIPVFGLNNTFSHNTRISIMVGPYGPFTNDFPKGQDSPEAINAWKQQQLQNVRLIAGA